LLVLLTGVLGCVGPYERGARFYRQGDLPRALAAWRGVEETHRDYERAQGRLQIVEAEFDRMLLRYEKRAQFFESEERLAEAVLYNRLAYKLDASRTHLLDRVQELARKLDRREREEHGGMIKALEEGRLRRASHHAARLEQLDPFNAALQIEIRQVHAAVGAEVLRHLEAGKRAYAAGQRGQARESFQSVLRFDPRNETALGYLSYIRRFEAMEAQRKIPPPPRSISSEEIQGEGHFRSARQAEQAGEPFSALSEYEAALRANPKHESARSALSALRRELRPQMEELYEAGKRYFQDEDLHNALRLWRRVLMIDPTHVRTRENVERAERILSRLEEIQTDDS
jgi:tetratricopeptide (TPR) repeat protein